MALSTGGKEEQCIANTTHWACQYYTSNCCVYTVNTKTVRSNLNSLNIFTQGTSSLNLKLILIR
jgi:hypothetical protein